MKEKDTVEKLEYLILKLGLPKEYDHSLRKVIAWACKYGYEFCEQRIKGPELCEQRVGGPEIVRVEWTEIAKKPKKGWKRVTRPAFRNLDPYKFHNELETYAGDGKVTGELSEKADYLLRISEIPAEFIPHLRPAIANAIVAGMSYLIQNLGTETELLPVNFWRPDTVIHLLNHADLGEFNRYFANFQKGELSL